MAPRDFVVKAVRLNASQRGLVRYVRHHIIVAKGLAWSQNGNLDVLANECDFVVCVLKVLRSPNLDSSFLLFDNGTYFFLVFIYALQRSGRCYL